MLKEFAVFFRRRVKEQYTLIIKARLKQYLAPAVSNVGDPSPRVLCLVKHLESKRAAEDKRLLGWIKQFWRESGFSYGYRNITLDIKKYGDAYRKSHVYL